MDNRAPGRFQLIQYLTRDIRLQFQSTFPGPMPPYHPNECAGRHPLLPSDPVPDSGFTGTDRYRFLTALAKIKLDAAADPDRVKIAHRTLLRIGIVDNFWNLGKRRTPASIDTVSNARIFMIGNFF